MDLSLSGHKGLILSIIFEVVEEFIRGPVDGEGIKELCYQALLSEFAHHNLASRPQSALQMLLCVRLVFLLNGPY